MNFFWLVFNIFFIQSSASFFAVLMEALIRAAQYDSNVFTIGFLRFFFGLLIIFPYLVKNKFTTYKKFEKKIS